MRKKKIVAVCATVALAAVALGGATLAYFTDTDQVNNTFAIGDLGINLYERADLDGDGEADTDIKFEKELNYSEIMPGDEMVKVPYIENTSTSDAYVRVFVQINNAKERNAAIDATYEAANMSQEDIQKKYDYIFNGWGINNTAVKDGIAGYTNGIRNSMAQRSDEGLDGVTIYGIDSVRCPYDDAGYQWESWNLFTATGEENDPNSDQNIGMTDGGYYQKALNANSNLYVFYLKLDAGKEYKLFDGLNVPADFTGEQLKMFSGLTVDIYADAIQVENFSDGDNATEDKTDTAWYKAFTALQEANPLGWWND